MTGTPGEATERSDAELISAVRAGDSSAQGSLFARHSGPAMKVARSYSRDAFSAEDLMSDAFERTVSAIQRGKGPDVAFRAYLYTTLRHQAEKQSNDDTRTLAVDDFSVFEGPASDTDPNEENFERRVVNAAFASLPERWREALWYLEVERMSPADIAPILGLTANGVSALGFRAREGLRQAYLQEHVVAIEGQCQGIREKLGAYARRGLGRREKQAVDRHLDECDKCPIILAELRDVGHGMRVIIAPLILGSVGAAGLLGMGHAPAASAAGFLTRFPRPSGRALAVAGATTAVLSAAAVTAAVVLPSIITTNTSAPLSPSPAVTPAEEPPDIVPQLPVLPPDAAPTTTPAPTPPPGASPPIELSPLREIPELPALPPVASPPAVNPPGLPPPPPPVTPTPEPQLTLALEDSGDLVLGRDGIVGFVAGNTGGSAAASVVVTVTLPAGVSVDAARTALVPPPAGWSCSPSAASVTCSIAELRVGSQAAVRLPVTVDAEADTATPVSASMATSGGAAATAGSGALVVASGVGARLILDGPYTIRQSGASFLDCDGLLPECVQARALEGPPKQWNNNEWFMRERTPSVTRLELPSGASVASASLYWSGYIPEGAGDAGLGQVSLLPPGGDAAVPVTASRVDRILLSGRTAYQATADVTDLVSANGGGDWAASDAQLTEDEGGYAGWALVVVLKDPTLEQSRVAIFDGVSRVGKASSSIFDVAVLPDADATVGVVAWEGDAATGGDALAIDGVPLTPLSPSGSASNAFDSTADGFIADGLPRANSFGVDAKRFRSIPIAGSRARVEASTDGDVYLVGAVTVESR